MWDFDEKLMSMLLKFSCINYAGKCVDYDEKLMSMLLKFSCINCDGKCGFMMKI